MMRVADHPPVVVDNGTGYTKLGFASNSEPSFVLPTCVSVDFDHTYRRPRGGGFHPKHHSRDYFTGRGHES